MIDREHQKLSVSRQCRLLTVSTVYYQPLGESAQTLALMRRIDELYLDYPFYGSRQMMRHLAREGVAVGRHRVRRLLRLLGLEAISWRIRIACIPIASSVESGVVRRYHLHSGALVAVTGRAGGCWPGGSNTLDTCFCLWQMRGVPEIFNTDQGSQFTSVAGCWKQRDTVLDGWPWALSGQRVHRTAVALAEVRGGVPARAEGRLRGAASDCTVA